MQLRLKKKKKYVDLTQKYRDSSLRYYKPQSSVHYGKVQYLLQAGKHNETVALLLNYFPTIAHNSEDRAVIAYMISQGFAKKKEAEQEKNG
jgi:hypothetical protein